MANWNFPAVKGGNINSINNAGLETFRDNPLESLTREICQNSLDAIKNPNEPVVVEFNKFSTSNFPAKEELIDDFYKCKSTWTGRNPKSEEFIEGALTTLNQPEISFLRISDFNTKGLAGAQEGELGSPWSSLVKEAGSSNKEDDSGGSFGIGKSAPFLISKIRTLFYSSYATDGFASHIGVSNIMSFRTDDDKITSGIGYYTNTYDSKAIEGLINLDESLEREKTGTDIFVSAFEPEDDWEQEVIKSVLMNFFITVYEKKLVVRVNGHEINHNNVGDLIQQLDENVEENQILKNYYYLLDSENKIVINYPAKTYKGGISFEKEEAQLYLMQGENLNRKVLMTRKNGMRIYEQNRISGSISFTGILKITGNKMNSIFKQMENPAHNGWSPNRFEKDPKLAEKIFADLRKFIRTQVKETFQNSDSDEMDAVGLSDFLPNKNLIEDNGQDSTESINSTVKDIKLKTKNTYASSKSSDPVENEKQLFGQYGITDGEKGGSGFTDTETDGGSGGGTSTPGGDNELDQEAEGNIDNQPSESYKTRPISSTQKYICTNKSSGLYKFFIKPNEAITKGQLKFKLLGEQSNYSVPIVSAHFTDDSISLEKITNNTIRFKSLNNPINEIKLNVKIDYPEYCAMEVSVYEN